MDKTILSEAEKPKTLTDSKIKEIQTLIYSTWDMLDPSGSNTKKYKEMFSKMTKKELVDYLLDIAYKEEENLEFEMIPMEREPSLDVIQKTANYLGIPLEEYVYFNHEGRDSLRTRKRVPVMYLTIRRLRVKRLLEVICLIVIL